jgi:D-alanyl-D-alanine carboxypeptidase
VNARWVWLIVVVAVAVVAGQFVLSYGRGPTPASSPAVANRSTPSSPTIEQPAPVIAPSSAMAPEPCEPDPAFTAAAAQNAQSLNTAAWSVFHRPESGWAIYAPLVAHELGVECAPNAEGFAAALSAWQRPHRLPPSGVMDAATLRALADAWQSRRPFVAASAHGVCPDPPPVLVFAAVGEGYGGKPVQLRPGPLAAYRRMVAAARRDDSVIAANPQLLTIFSGYRDPAADAARCVVQANCDSIVRATCSAHRTGLAMDVYLGAAAGYPPDSSADANRLYQSRSAAYHWMVAHAAEFGFVNYPFEPWHWEWTGEAP